MARACLEPGAQGKQAGCSKVDRIDLKWAANSTLRQTDHGGSDDVLLQQYEFFGPLKGETSSIGREQKAEDGKHDSSQQMARARACTISGLAVLLQCHGSERDERLVTEKGGCL